jgi:hypothetical protein
MNRIFSGPKVVDTASLYSMWSRLMWDGGRWSLMVARAPEKISQAIFPRRMVRSSLSTPVSPILRPNLRTVASEDWKARKCSMFSYSKPFIPSVTSSIGVVVCWRPIVFHETGMGSIFRLQPMLLLSISCNRDVSLAQGHDMWVAEP